MLLIHTSDLHLVPDQFQDTILESSYYSVLEEISDNVLREKAKYLLISGDMFNTDRPSMGIVIKTVGVLKKLVDSGVRVVVVPGNHDLSRTRTSVLDLLARAGLIHLLDFKEEMGWLILEPLVFQDDRLVFYGVPGFRGSSNREVEYLKHGTTRFRGLRDYSNYELIILAHINTKFAGYDPSRYSKRYGQLYMEYEDFLHKLPENTRYIALGHVHLPIPMDDAFKGKIAYPGAPIGLDTADLKETFELGKIGGFRRILRVDLSIETPLVKSLRLENTPRVYYRQLITKSIDEAKSEVKKLIDEVEPGKYTVVLVDVKGLESASMELENYALELMKSYRKMNLFVKIRSTVSELEEYAPSIDITPESKELSIEEIELRVIKEYLAKRRINMPPEKIQWLINTLGQGMSGSVEKVIQEILKEIGGE